MVHNIRSKYELLLNGTIVTWKTKPVDIELQPDAKSYYAKPYPVTRAHTYIFNSWVWIFLPLWFLKIVNISDLGDPTIIQSKNSGTIRLLYNCRNLDWRIFRKLFAIPKIQYMMLNLEGFTHTSLLDLNMGYSNIKLYPGSKILCTFVLPWGKYEYQNLYMGVCYIPNIFQENTPNLFKGFNIVHS